MIFEPKITQIETLNFRAKFNPNVNMIVNLVFPAFLSQSFRSITLCRVSQCLRITPKVAF